MRIVSSLLMIVFFSFSAETAYVVLEDGKMGRIDIPDSTELYNSNLNSFQAVSKNGNYNLLKQNVKYLVIDRDTLRFIGNVAQSSVHLPESETTTVSDELPEPLKSGNNNEGMDVETIEDVSVPDRTVVIGSQNTGRLLTEMQSNRKVAVHGAVVYGMSLGLQYGVALPLSIAAVANNEPGIAIGSLIVSAIAGGMSISGSTRCGVGASLTYDTSRKYNLGLGKNINWAFYGVGWAFQAVNSVLSLLVITDPDLQVDLALPSMLIGMASTGMFITSVANASHYSRNGLNKVTHASLKMDIVPVVSIENRCAGMVLNCSF